MTISEIVSTVEIILKRDAADWTIGTMNMVYNAVNEARKEAEKLHDFSVCRRGGYYTITNGTIRWMSPVWLDTLERTRLRKGVNWYLKQDWVPGDAQNVGTASLLQVVSADSMSAYENQMNFVGIGMDTRYPGVSADVSHAPYLCGNYLSARGRLMELLPSTPTGAYIFVDGYAWWPEWPVGFKAWTIVRADPKATTGISILCELEFTIDGVNYLDSTSVLLSSTREQFLTAMQTLISDMGFDTDEVWAELDGNDIVINSPVGSYARLLFQGDTSVQDDATTDELNDWWEQNASDYLIWAAVCKLNYRDDTFVGNREGNLPAPVRQRDAALASLIANDSDAMMAGRAILQF